MEKIWENISRTLVPLDKLCTVPMGTKQSKQVSYKYEIANSLGEIELIVFQWPVHSLLASTNPRVKDAIEKCPKEFRRTIHVRRCQKYNTWQRMPVQSAHIIRLTCMSTRIATNTLGTKLSNSLVKISDIKIVKTCEDQSPVIWSSLPLRAT